jgi:hypothetical protein
VELLVIGVVVLALLAVFGLAAALISFVVWLVLLPLQLMAILFKFLGFLIALPFIVIGGVLAIAAVSLGAMFLFAPLMPLILIGVGLFWLLRRRPSGQAVGQPTT